MRFEAVGQIVTRRRQAKTASAASAVEQRILGVQMEMDKVRVQHAVKLLSGGKRAQGRDVHHLPRGSGHCG
jgi:hypothetical protein